MEELIKQLDKLNLNQYAFIDKNDIPFSRDVVKMCEQNSCGKYNTNWQCPPAVGDFDKLKEKCLKYDNVLMFNMVYELEDSFDFEGMSIAGSKHNDLNFKIRDVFKKCGIDDLLILGAGGCSICDKCSYLDNIPCRFPDKSFASIEAHGIYVAQLAPNVGFKYINGANTVTYFTMVFF